MHGVAGRKGVVGLARAWNAMTAAMDHLPIRPLLVDHPLQKMRQDRGRGHAQNQVIGLSTRTTIAITRRQPKSGPRSQAAGVHRQPRSGAGTGALQPGLRAVQPPEPPACRAWWGGAATAPSSILPCCGGRFPRHPFARVGLGHGALLIRTGAHSPDGHKIGLPPVTAMVAPDT